MRKLALIILDGWGLGEENEHNAIYKARTPFFDSIWNNYPHTQLEASGEFVGLPEGQIGGSEVGHLTIGAGKVYMQDLPRISRAFQHLATYTEFTKSPSFNKLIALARKKRLHLIGLVSSGGVHSHEEHLFEILRILKEHECLDPYIHFISDGRDTFPKSGKETAERLITHMQQVAFGTIATLVGRYYAMDRDNNWDRTEIAINLYLHGSSESSSPKSADWQENLINSFTYSYEREINDEFIEPVVINPDFHGIQAGEPIFFFNYRSDRMRQIVSKMEEKLSDNPLFTMTRYTKDFSQDVLFEKEDVKLTLGEIISMKGLSQLRAAETEKAPHVTNFFNGGRDQIFERELRTVEKSHKVKHDEIPEMQAEKITDNIRRFVATEQPDFVLVNFANPDMVGHTGNFQAVVTGVEKVDQELKRLCEFLAKEGYICCVTADHGNADIMFDPVAGQPHTAHTLNPVPFIIYDPRIAHPNSLHLDHGPENGLSRIAGTVLKLMEIDKKEHFEDALVK